MSRETIARRYSTALADVVIGTGETETVKAELSGWTEIFRDSSDLQTVFSNPAIAHSNKEKVLEDLIAKANPCVLMRPGGVSPWPPRRSSAHWMTS